MKKIISIVLVSLIVVMGLVGCGSNNTNEDIVRTFAIGDALIEEQPTPTDFDYSLERWNLIRRAYWVNGQREKALNQPCPIPDVPLGYIVLFTESGATVGSFIVNGKISSLNSFLTPDEAYVYDSPIRRYSDNSSTFLNGEAYMTEMPDVDGSYGANDSGIFFFTPDGKYIEWNGTYIYSDIPFEIDDPIVRVG